MKTVTLSRKAIFWGILILILMVGLGLTYVLLPGANGKDNNRVAGVKPPEQVAVEFTHAFYAVDYRDKAGWLAKLKPMATEAGVGLLDAMLAPALWAQLTPAQTVTLAENVTVTDAGVKAENAERHWQIRALTVSVTPRWPMMTADSLTVYILLEQSVVDNQWRYAAYMSESDVQNWKGK